MIRKILAIILLPIFILACGKKSVESKKIQGDKFLFGTHIAITIYDEDEAAAKKAMEAAFDEIERIDHKYNSKVKGSLIEQLNSGAVDKVTLDDEGVYLIQNLKNIYELSNGYYDVTITPVLDVWNFGEKERSDVPSFTELQKALSKVDFTKVILDGNELYYAQDDIELDTGSFLKGYAVEKAKGVLKDMGIESAFISSISSIETINTKPDGKSWRIGIENPQDPKKLLGIVELDNQGMGVSGDYQTYIEINGKRYHHILDKSTGYPVEGKKMIVVISDNAFLSDMYSTAFFTMQTEEIMEFAEKNNLEVLIVDNNMNITRTEGMKFECAK
ncbi:FAD:protein FMN transferase [uncultured Fusobacterium sp.]|uniref:FAD:protein FMN transferase n=1 Tax=uncultured Fusobacterium sp. TaxID=159267 RepID=UPI00258F02ED|nr:FAD:protein FMN transferase [uncultured Fusobacterium sp.]